MKKIMIAGFWALLLIPNLLFPFVKGGSQTGTGENRNLAEFHRIHMRRIRLRSTVISMTMRHSETCS